MKQPTGQQQARKLQATLDGCKPKLRPPTDLLTGMKSRATSVAKKKSGQTSYTTGHPTYNQPNNHPTIQTDNLEPGGQQSSGLSS